MRWNASVEMAGKLTDEQIELVADGETRSSMAIFNGDAATAMLRFTIDADAYDQATCVAIEMLGKMTSVRATHRQGRAVAAVPTHGPKRGSREAGFPHPSTAGAAKRLGVSEARIRQLKHDIDFPKLFKIPGAAGDFYHSADIDEYRASRKPGTPDQGKPRATDEPLLNHALVQMLQYTGLTSTQRGQITQQRRPRAADTYEAKQRSCYRWSPAKRTNYLTHISKIPRLLRPGKGRARFIGKQSPYVVGHSISVYGGHYPPSSKR